jgi:hypothetical protein
MKILLEFLIKFLAQAGSLPVQILTALVELGNCASILSRTPRPSSLALSGRIDVDGKSIKIVSASSG